MVTYPKSLDQKLSGQGLSLTHHGVLGAQHRSWEREGVRAAGKSHTAVGDTQDTSTDAPPSISHTHLLRQRSSFSFLTSCVP